MIVTAACVFGIVIALILHKKGILELENSFGYGGIYLILISICVPGLFIILNRKIVIYSKIQTAIKIIAIATPEIYFVHKLIGNILVTQIIGNKTDSIVFSFICWAVSCAVSLVIRKCKLQIKSSNKKYTMMHEA